MKNNLFLNIYAWAFIALFIGGVYVLYMMATVLSEPVLKNYFGMTISVWYLAAGIGILARRIWGYYFLKSFLFILLVAFPIGTFIAYTSLKYMKKSSIKNEFNT